MEKQRRSPPWSRDELILALSLYLRHGPSQPGSDSPEVKELSARLNELGRHIGLGAGAAFRNKNGVHMKLMNYRALDPGFPKSKGLSHGGRLEREVWAEFSSDPSRCHRTADLILAAMDELRTKPVDLESDLAALDQEEAEEGRIITRLHVSRERDRRIVRKKKEHCLKVSGKLACEGCGFDFEAAYGRRGYGFIECHHDVAISELLPGQKTKAKDLRLVCSNCHRIVHRVRPWLTIDQLREILT